LLFRRWPRLEIERIVGEIATTLPGVDDESNVHITELREFMSFFD
jgi:hypothetical protein